MDLQDAPLIIAEIGGNHRGSLRMAKELIRSAAECGCDAVKFQCFNPEEMVGDPNYVLEDGPWAGRNLLDLYYETRTPFEWFPDLFAHAESCGIVPFSSVFSPLDVNFLEDELDPVAYKISSFEMVDLDLIRAVASTGKIGMISMGMAADEEVWTAMDVWDNNGGGDLIMMECTSAYPAAPADANLSPWMRGLSDHTAGIGVAVAAVALGAKVIEKHFTLSRADGGPDAAFSLEPHEMRSLVIESQRAYDAVYGTCSPESERPQQKLRRSLWWAKSLPKGHVVQPCDIKTCRPNLGAHPHRREAMTGKALKHDVEANTPCLWTGIE